MPRTQRFYYIDDQQVDESAFYSRLRDDMRENGDFNSDTFDDELQDSYGDIEINGHSFSAAEILRATDYYDNDLSEWEEDTVDNAVDLMLQGEILTYNDTEYSISNTDKNAEIDNGVAFDDNTWGVKNA